RALRTPETSASSAWRNDAKLLLGEVLQRLFEVSDLGLDRDSRLPTVAETDELADRLLRLLERTPGLLVARLDNVAGHGEVSWESLGGTPSMPNSSRMTLRTYSTLSAVVKMQSCTVSTNVSGHSCMMRPQTRCMKTVASRFCKSHAA